MIVNVSWSAYHALQCTVSSGKNLCIVNSECKNSGYDPAFTQSHKSSSLAHKPGPDYSCNSKSAIVRFSQKDKMVLARCIWWNYVRYTYWRLSPRNGFSLFWGTGWMVVGGGGGAGLIKYKVTSSGMAETITGGMSQELDGPTRQQQQLCMLYSVLHKTNTQGHIL